MRIAQTSLMSLILAALFLVLISPAGRANDSAVLICDIWPPYQIETQEGVAGFSVDVVTAVYKRMDVQIESISAYPWKRALEILQHGRADALFSANYTSDREYFARYPSETLVESPWVIWTRGKSITSLEDLKGKTIGVVLGYSYTPEFWKFIETYCNVQQVRSDETNFAKLGAGRLDATVAEYGNGLHLISSLKLENIIPYLEFPIKEDGLYIVFNRASVSEGFVKEFSEELKVYKGTDEYRALREKYFGELS